eukprot:Pgem_evm1s14976
MLSLPKSKSGAQGALFGIDSASSFAWYRLVFNTNASTTDNIGLIDQIKPLGKIKQIFGDSHQSFTSTEFKEYCQMSDIEHITVPPKHHDPNGKVERFIGTIVKALRMKCTDAEEWINWDMLLPIVVNEYNHCQTPVGKAPIELLLKSDIDYEKYLADNNLDPLAVRQRKRIHFNDKCFANKNLEPGDLFLAKDKDRQNKLLPKWIGPYSIDFIDDHQVATLVAGNKSLRRHTNDLKYYAPSSFSGNERSGLGSYASNEYVSSCLANLQESEPSHYLNLLTLLCTNSGKNWLKHYARTMAKWVQLCNAANLAWTADPSESPEVLLAFKNAHFPNSGAPAFGRVKKTLRAGIKFGTDKEYIDKRFQVVFGIDDQMR